MSLHLWRSLAPVIRAVVVGLVLLLLLLRTYGLFLAAAVMPHRAWRERLDFHIRRAVFAMERIRLGGLE